MNDTYLIISNMASSVDTLVTVEPPSTRVLMLGSPGWMTSTMKIPTMAARIVVVM